LLHWIDIREEKKICAILSASSQVLDGETDMTVPNLDVGFVAV